MPYKEFANGSPLPASDIDTFLMDQSVMTFANSTARATALPSPKEGMLTYLEDTNAYEGWTGSAWVNINDNSAAIPRSVITSAGDLIVGTATASVTRLGIGTNGQVLSSNGTTATWITPAVAGAEDWVELVAPNTTIPTGSTTASLTGLSGRSKYLLIIDGVSSVNASSNFTIRINNTTNLYQAFGTRLIGAATYSAGNMESIQSTGNVPFATLSTSAGSTATGAFFISAANTGNRKYFEWNGVANANGVNGNSANFGRGVWRQNADVSSLELVSSTGNIDAGTWAFYGSVN